MTSRITSCTHAFPLLRRNFSSSITKTLAHVTDPVFKSSASYLGRLLIFELSQKNLIRAAEIERTMKSMQATRLIVSYYKSLTDLPPNDEDSDPTVSFILDDQCDFLICNRRNISQEKPLSSQDIFAHRILFELDSVLISEFPSRDIPHSIYKIYKNSTVPNQEIWPIMSYLNRTEF